MKCPNCHQNGSRVVDSRPADNGHAIRRRRECENCGFRFTTFERVEAAPLLVIKKNGAREEFNREKVLRGVMRAAEKRPVQTPLLPGPGPLQKSGPQPRGLFGPFAEGPGHPRREKGLYPQRHPVRLSDVREKQRVFF